MKRSLIFALVGITLVRGQLGSKYGVCFLDSFGEDSTAAG